jgi:DNA-damage-inducible protein J
MAAEEHGTLVQTKVDREVEERARAILETIGLSIPEALRIFLTRTADEGAAPFDLSEPPGDYDAWFRDRVEQALADAEPPVDDDEVRLRFSELRHSAGAGTTLRRS